MSLLKIALASSYYWSHQRLGILQILCFLSVFIMGRCYSCCAYPTDYLDTNSSSSNIAAAQRNFVDTLRWRLKTFRCYAIVSGRFSIPPSLPLLAVSQKRPWSSLSNGKLSSNQARRAAIFAAGPYNAVWGLYYTSAIQLTFLIFLIPKLITPFEQPLPNSPCRPFFNPERRICRIPQASLKNEG